MLLCRFVLLQIDDLDLELRIGRHFDGLTFFDLDVFGLALTFVQELARGCAAEALRAGIFVATDLLSCGFGLGRSSRRSADGRRGLCHVDRGGLHDDAGHIDHVGDALDGDDTVLHGQDGSVLVAEGDVVALIAIAGEGDGRAVDRGGDGIGGDRDGRDRVSGLFVQLGQTGAELIHLVDLRAGEVAEQLGILADGLILALRAQDRLAVGQRDVRGRRQGLDRGLEVLERLITLKLGRQGYPC